MNVAQSAHSTPAHVTLAGTLWPAGKTAPALRWITLMVVGSLALAVSAKLHVPFWPVPLTMQPFVVLVIGAAYGWRLGGATVLLYLAEGATGLPVFSGTPERGLGLAYMAGPTGGYLMGFAFSAAAIGWLAERGWDRDPIRTFAAMAFGHAVIFVFGVTWLAGFMGSFAAAWVAGAVPFYVGTLVQTALATAVLPLAWRLVGQRRG
ncbi:biotin transporter BioY [Rhodospirillaceae bacterium SYSU D60014]|uniref:biotin transporter BioY n=1 Tax=Virgifigura deserti TaxID=2268457 RepID=UPI000E66F6A8